MSASRRRATHVRRPARSLRVGIVRAGAIVEQAHVELEVPLSVGLSGLDEDGGPVRILPTGAGPLLLVGRGVSGRLGRQGRVRPLCEWMTVVDSRQGVLLEAGDRVRVGLAGGAVLLQGMPRAAVEPVDPGAFRPLLVQRDDAPFLGLLSTCASAAMALLVVAAGIEPVDSQAQVEIPRRVVQVLMRPVVETVPEPVVAPTPEVLPVPVPQVTAQAEPEPTVEVPPVRDAVAEARDRRVAALTQRSAVLGRMDQIQEMLAGTDGEDALADALAKATGPDLIASKRTDSGLRAGSGDDGRMDATVDFGGGLGGGGLRRGPAGGREVVERAIEPTAPVARRPKLTIQRPPPGESRSVIDEVRHRYARQLQACYQRRVNVDPSIRGRVELAFDVENGVVAFVAVTENGTGDEALATCLESRAGRWRFDKEAEGSFAIPLVFEMD